jgi:hypothetical protein
MPDSADVFGRLIPPLPPASLVVYAGDNDLDDGKTPELGPTSIRAQALMVERDLGHVYSRRWPARNPDTSSNS